MRKPNEQQYVVTAYVKEKRLRDKVSNPMSMYACLKFIKSQEDLNKIAIPKYRNLSKFKVEKV